MSNQFLVFHKNQPGLAGREWPQGHWQLATCLRTLVLVDGSVAVDKAQLDDDYEVFQGTEAYEFLLSIICGLESPMLGETEILGQFKTFVKAQRETFTPLVRDVVENLLRDAKNIRTEYLQNLGCTSYGSLLRKHLKEQNGKIILIGAGSLTRDILPWLAKTKHDVEVYTRSPKNHQDLVEQNPNLELSSLDELSETTQADVLVLAAPVDAEKIHSQLSLDQFTQIFDLRGESESDPVEGTSTYRLKELFASIETNRKQASEIKGRALVAIEKMAGSFHLQEKQRPFGWEDLWIYA